MEHPQGPNHNSVAMAVAAFAGSMEACHGSFSDLSWSRVIAAGVIALVTGFCYRAGAGIAAWAKGKIKPGDDVS